MQNSCSEITEKYQKITSWKMPWIMSSTEFQEALLSLMQNLLTLQKSVLQTDIGDTSLKEQFLLTQRLLVQIKQNLKN